MLGKTACSRLLALPGAVVLALIGASLVAASPAAAAPTNDMFANPTALTGWGATARANLVGATMEPGEPDHYGIEYPDVPEAGGHSVWYRWTAPAKGRIELWGVHADAVNVYTGGSIQQVAPVPAGYCDESSGFVSYECVVLNVQAGVTYRFAVDGYEGQYDLRMRRILPPSNDNFGTALTLTGLSTGDSIGEGGDMATAQPGEPRHANDPLTPSKSVWYRWTSTWASAVSFTAGVTDPGSHSSCYASPTSIAVYTGTSFADLRVVAFGRSTEEDISNCQGPTVSFDGRAKTTYLIAVDIPEWFRWQVMSAHLNAAPSCSVNGTAGNDALTGSATNDVLCGGEGDDVLKGGGGDDLLIGGPGIDAASFADATSGVVADLTTKTATGHGADTLQDIENLIGSAYADKLDGNAGTNTLNGGAGSDLLWGQAGIDTILGSNGNDTVGGGPGNDRVNGGAGTDLAHFGKATAVTVNLTTGSATGEGTDVLTLVEDVSGSPGADKLTGTNGINMLQGAGGNDTIFGQGGNDKLHGAGGNDTLTGGVGTDTCDGGIGTDTAVTCERRVAFP
jgi:Ca2+-binding RTX toxin-like protein